MIAPIIQWDHSQSMSKIEFNRCGEWFDRRSVLINISDKESSYLKGHVIDGESHEIRNCIQNIKFLFFVGKILLPGTAILVFVWESLSMMNNTNKEDFPVIFEEVKFLRATTLKENQDVILHISVHSGKTAKTCVPINVFKLMNKHFQVKVVSKSLKVKRWWQLELLSNVRVVS